MTQSSGKPPGERLVRGLFDRAPVLLCEVDTTGALAEIAALGRSPTDARARLAASLDAARQVVGRMRAVAVDAAWLRALDVQDEGAFLARLEAWFVPDTYFHLAAALATLAEGGRSHGGESAMGTREGTRRQVYVTLHGFPPQDGLARALLGIMDMGPPRPASVSLDPDSLPRVLVESLPQPIWMSNPDGAITYCNPAMADLLGLPVDHAPCAGPQAARPERVRDWIDLCEAEERDQLRAARRQAREQGVAHRGTCRLYSREGAGRVISFVETPVQRGSHGLAGWAGTATDISLLAQGQQELQRALRHAHLDLAQIARATSHDFQEPLRMVTSYVQLLSLRYAGELDARAGKYIRYAVEGAKRMQDLLRDMRALYQAGNETQRVQPVSAGELVARVIESMHRQITASQAAISCGPLPVVRADARQLALLFRHLLENAIRFCGDAPPRIFVGAAREGEMWRFDVRDSGIGFDAAAYGERVFLMFRRLHTRDAYPGTGIGLAIARKIVERHGGHIRAHAEPGQGATFSFTLPAAAPERAG